MLAESQWALVFGAAKKRGARWPDNADVEAFKREVLAAVDVRPVITSSLVVNETPVRDTQHRRISAKGMGLIHSFESCKLEAYPDPGSKDGHPWTIGWGSTGADIARGLRWTQQQCDERFARDIGKYEQAVDKATAGVPTTQNQFDAMVSLTYNIGIKGFQGSTVLRKHKAGDYLAAARAFLLWNKNDKVVMRGLTRRRLAEADLYDDPEGV